MTITVHEHEETRLACQQITSGQGATLWQRYGNYVAVMGPSLTTNNQWVLKSQGWVGGIVVDAELRVMLQPKTPVANIFGMLEYAYRLNSFHLLDGVAAFGAIDEMFQQLAIIFAKRVLDRARIGLHRPYLAHTQQSPVVRGRIDLPENWRAPHRHPPTSRFQERTTDCKDNQIIAFTLQMLARHRLSRDASGLIRTALHRFAGAATPMPCQPSDCINRHYTRINQDYQLLHALCRFFLEHSGPTHQLGDRTMIPFLVNMGRLFELFVAQWLLAHLPAEYRLVAQERVAVDAAGAFPITLDMVIYNAASNRPLLVIDTKYKTADSPSPDDLQQVVAYSVARGCASAVLIYPTQLRRPFNGRYGQSEIAIRTVAFDIATDIEKGGRRMLEELLLLLSESPA
ncbi:MAG: restriction endonuclease [Armatimonadetes bacterium]|nr:restriction endonuclease [Armatimonadota bacterium]